MPTPDEHGRLTDEDLARFLDYPGDVLPEGVRTLIAEIDRLRAVDQVWQLRWQQQFDRAERAEQRLADADPSHLTIDLSNLDRPLESGDLLRIEHRDGTQVLVKVLHITEAGGAVTAAMTGDDVDAG